MAARARGETLAALQVNDAETLAAAVRAGIGKSLLPCFLADADPRLMRLGSAEPVLFREIWLLSHRESRSEARIAATIGWIEEIVATRLGPNAAPAAGDPTG